MKIETVNNNVIMRSHMNKQETKKAVTDSKTLEQPKAHAKTISEELVTKSIEVINEEIQKTNENYEVNYVYHEESKQLMISVMDKEKTEVVFEFPAEKLLDFAAHVEAELKAAMAIDKKI